MLPEFAVIDVETTGFNAEGSDRIIEIAVIRLDRNGRVQNEFETLVNPERDVGPTSIHGITATAAARAPRFSEIAGDVLREVSDAVIVGHNISFDLRFLYREFSLTQVGRVSFPSLCTLALSRTVVPGQYSRKLGALCRELGITLNAAHSAMGDARATADLLNVLMSRMGGWKNVDLDNLPIRNSDSLGAKLPFIAGSGRRLTREAANEVVESQPSPLAAWLARMPQNENYIEEPDITEYLALLDRVVEDRRITFDEVESLRALAEELGLTAKLLGKIHHGYLHDLVAAAWADGVVTESETQDLEQVARLLDIRRDNVHALIEELDQTAGLQAPQIPDPTKRDLEGKTICFSGELRSSICGVRVSKEQAASLAAEKGMVVKSSVTKKLDFLVVADPDSQSSKAKKARKYGVRVIVEPVLWRMLGVCVDP